MTPDPIRTRLWREGADKNVFVILDGAQNETLLDKFDESEDLEYECLMTDQLEPDMAEVAPYVVKLEEDAPFTRWLMEQGWAQNWGIFLVSHEGLPAVWRHMRRHIEVRSPDRKILFFRFYDPRVLAAFLPTCDAKQLNDFFGVVDLFVAEMEGGSGAYAYSLGDGGLVTETIGMV